MVYDVCIIGGGASGLAAGIAARREGASVLILERMDKAGRKILATGNGKCNLTNTVIIKKHIPSDAYRCTQKQFPAKVLSAFDAEDTLAFFESIALYTKDKNGYVYPASEQASAVCDALKWALAEQKASMITDADVLHIRYQPTKHCFIIETHKQTYTGRKLILATGGQSTKSLGSNGSGYTLSRQLGHRILPVVPALCALRCSEKFFKDLAGIRIQGKVHLFADGCPMAEDRGEIQLTNYGISGIPVFQVSRYAAYGLEKGQEVTAILDFMPDMVPEELLNRLLKQSKNHPDWTMGMILSGMLNKKLSSCLLKLCHCTADRPGKDTNRSLWQKIVSQIKRTKVHITGTNGFEQSQVSAGGVDTREVNAWNLSSKKIPGLYIVGELLDVDGICGGYNLQWAWSTGILAGTDAGRSIHDQN